MRRNLALYLANRMWRLHPGVRSDDQLTPGERAADRLRNVMGSWAFVFVALVFRPSKPLKPRRLPDPSERVWR